MKEKVFNVGELVRVNEKTHEESIHPNRVGVVTGMQRKPNGEPNGIYKVLFTSSKGTHEMIFWHGFLERIGE